MSRMRLFQWQIYLSSLYKSEKDGEIVGIIVENKHTVNGLEIRFCNDNIQPRVFYITFVAALGRY